MLSPKEWLGQKLSQCDIIEKEVSFKLGTRTVVQLDRLQAPGAAGVGLDIDSAKRQTDHFVIAHRIVGCIVPVSTSGSVSLSC